MHLNLFLTTFLTALPLLAHSRYMRPYMGFTRPRYSKRDMPWNAVLQAEKEIWDDYYKYKSEKRAAALRFLREHEKFKGADSSWRLDGFSGGDMDGHEEDVGHGFYRRSDDESPNDPYDEDEMDYMKAYLDNEISKRAALADSSIGNLGSVYGWDG